MSRFSFQAGIKTALKIKLKKCDQIAWKLTQNLSGEKKRLKCSINNAGLL